jgi:hypothetical protein
MKVKVLSCKICATNIFIKNKRQLFSNNFSARIINARSREKCYIVKPSARRISTGFKRKCSYLKTDVRNIHTGTKERLHILKSKTIVSLHNKTFSIFSVALQPFGSWPLFFSFLILNVVGRTPLKGDQPVAMPLPVHRTGQTQNKHTQTPMPRVGFEPTTTEFERAKTVHVLDRADTVIGNKITNGQKYLYGIKTEVIVRNVSARNNFRISKQKCFLF